MGIWGNLWTGDIGGRVNPYSGQWESPPDRRYWSQRDHNEEYWRQIAEQERYQQWLEQQQQRY